MGGLRISWGLAVLIALLGGSGRLDADTAGGQPTTRPTTQANLAIVEADGGTPGNMAKVVAEASPGAKCTIEYITPKGTQSRAAGLGDKTADSDGKVTWTWRISAHTEKGAGTVIVKSNGQMAASQITIQ